MFRSTSLPSSIVCSGTLMVWSPSWWEYSHQGHQQVLQSGLPFPGKLLLHVYQHSSRYNFKKNEKRCLGPIHCNSDFIGMALALFTPCFLILKFAGKSSVWPGWRGIPQGGDI